jgi:nitroreductase
MFYVASSDAAKQTLAAHAYHQPQITQAAHTLIICGTTPPQDYVAHGLQAAHDSGIMPEEIAKNWVSMAEGMYANQPQLQRDEAIRSASLAAMCLMLAAEAKGYATCPMIGFDPKAVHQSFAIPEHHIPVMLLPIGYAAAQAWPQKPRHPAAAVMKTL